MFPPDTFQCNYIFSSFQTVYLVSLEKEAAGLPKRENTDAFFGSCLSIFFLILGSLFLVKSDFSSGFVFFGILKFASGTITFWSVNINNINSEDPIEHNDETILDGLERVEYLSSQLSKIMNWENK